MCSALLYCSDTHAATVYAIQVHMHMDTHLRNVYLDIRNVYAVAVSCVHMNVAVSYVHMHV